MSLRPKAAGWRQTTALAVGWLVLGAGGLQAAPSREPFSYAVSGARWHPGDERALAQLAAGRGGMIWLARIYPVSRVTPPMRGCEVYLWPQVRQDRLRRGRRLSGHTALPGARTPWQLSDRPAAYAQVALPGKRFRPGLERPGPLDAPFAVDGEISGQDLVAVADAVRNGGPDAPAVVTKARHVRNQDGTEDIETVLTMHGISVDRGLPVTSVQVQDRGHVKVRTSGKDGGSGQEIDLRRDHGRWEIGTVGMWNA